MRVHKFFRVSLCFLVIFNPVFCPSLNASEIKAQNVQNNELKLNNSQNVIPTASNFSYNFQKYTGLNFLIHFLACTTIKTIIKIKTHADNVFVDLDIYSGWDLLKKKAKSLKIRADGLFVKDIPIEYFELEANSPIYFKKNSLKKNQVALPVNIITLLKVNLSNINEVINSLPKWQKVLGGLDLPVPPFGTTKVALNNFKIEINESGFVYVSSTVRSLVNSESEPLKIVFFGNLQLKDKKIIINGLESEVEGIFTKDSDIGISFSKFLEDLINPVFDLGKFEKNGHTIDNVNLSFESNRLILKINSRLLPEQEVGI